MTTVDTTRTYDGNGVAVASNGADYFVFPEPEYDQLDQMTLYKGLHHHGSAYLLRHHFGDSPTTIIDSEHYIAPGHTGDLTGLRYPDLLIAFDADPEALNRSNAYVISEQGKPPDFVLEIASPSTGDVDVGPKRDDYAALSIPEYWRFDETGESHGTRLAGDRLVDGRYEPIEILEVEDGILQGYSQVLNLHLRWEDGRLRWHDPETGQHIPTFESEREARIAERERANREWQSRVEESIRADEERQARLEERERADREHQARLEEQARADREQARADALEAEIRHLRSE